MTTETQSLTELEAFHRFVGEQLANGGRKATLEETLAAFREYQEQLERARREIQPALERSLRGEGKPFDAEEIKRRVTETLAEEGITD